MKKMIITVAVMVSVFLCSSLNSMACNQTPGCYEQNTHAVCGGKTGDLYYKHYCPELNDGTGGYCDVYKAGSSHRLYCIACGAYICNETRTCEITHTHCGAPGIYNLCQY